MDEFKMIEREITLHCDSQSAIHLVKNTTFHDHTKYIDIKYHFIRKLVEEGRILLEKIDIDENAAHILTNFISIENI